MESNESGQESTNLRKTAPKPDRGKETLFFLVNLVLAFIFLLLHLQGIELWEISPGKSLIRLLTIVSFILLIFSSLSQATRLISRLRHYPLGEAQMLVGFLKAVAIMVLILAVVESMGKVTAFTAIGAGFAGMLLGWSLQAPGQRYGCLASDNLKKTFPDR